MKVWIVFRLYDGESENVESVHAIEQDALDEARHRTDARTGWALHTEEYYVRPYDVMTHSVGNIEALIGDLGYALKQATYGKATIINGAMSDYIDIVFDGPPSHESGRFIEVEDSAKASISIGEWLPDGDLWRLRIPDPRRIAALSDAVAVSVEVFMEEAAKLGRREEASLLKRVAFDED